MYETLERYRTIKRFRDSATNRVYEVGDVFPSTVEAAPTEERLEELSTTKNRYNEPFIAKIGSETMVEPVKVEPQPVDAPEVEGGEPDEPQPAKPKPSGKDNSKSFFGDLEDGDELDFRSKKPSPEPFKPAPAQAKLLHYE